MTKQLQKSKIEIKKKKDEISDLKKQLKKQHMIENSSSLRQLGKNKFSIEEEFDKMQAQFDKEKVELEKQIIRLEKQSDDRLKQLRKIEGLLMEKIEKEKIVEVKYAGLKKFTSQKQNEYIEYREKAQEYNAISLKNQEMLGTLRVTSVKLASLEEENKKLKDLNMNVNNKLVNIEKEWNRLKKLERQFESTKNENVNQRMLIDSFEKRYQELKSFCIKIQSTYNSYIEKRRKQKMTGVASMSQSKEDKQILQQLAELDKKIN